MHRMVRVEFAHCKTCEQLAPSLRTQLRPTMTSRALSGPLLSWLRSEWQVKSARLHSVHSDHVFQKGP
jgi:hypothetical protein